MITRLDAINRMLMSIGEAPINNAEMQGNADAISAGLLLDQTNIAVQSEGWFFNTRKDVKLTPEAFMPYRIFIPANTLSVIAKDCGRKYAIRGNQLYDVNEDTPSFTGPVTVDLVYLQDWEMLPPDAAIYIAIRAAREFQTTFVGSSTSHKMTEEQEQRARVALLNASTARGRYNTLDNNPIYQRTASKYRRGGGVC